MAVHSFESLGEIQASSEVDREAATAKVLAESKTFDAALGQAVTKEDPVQRKEALLKLESLPEFKRSHPTVEHFTPLLVAAGAAGKAEVESIGISIVEPGMSYVNYRFRAL
jgi:4,5-DOPA dioxygenase extradiol